ncbi:MAG: hypothetical protein OQK27_05655 [Gammaproteobacteria bacterium]|nr:hypothetical protein [Gammaproteobacteria bacterium]MCW9057845.1 hypothetical protein [Gammaproteobacteria bacterium]
MKKALLVSALIALLSATANAADQAPSWTFANYDEIMSTMRVANAQDATIVRKKDGKDSSGESGIVYGELGW